MAILGVDSLTGCSSIPSFLGGSSDTPANPSITIFHNTNAPVNWTKSTSHDNKSLRVIGGINGTALSNGGVTPFTSIFTTRTTSATSSTNPAGATIGAQNANAPLSTDPSGPGTTDGTSLPSTQLPPHTHPYVYVANGTVDAYQLVPQVARGATSSITSTLSPGGPGATHTHSVTAPHSHFVTVPNHPHPISNAGPHSHTFSLSQDFAVLYVDVIIATKS